MKESYLCMSRAANLKMDHLDLNIIGENAMGWSVLIAAMKSSSPLGCYTSDL